MQTVTEELQLIIRTKAEEAIAALKEYESAVNDLVGSVENNDNAQSSLNDTQAESARDLKDQARNVDMLDGSYTELTDSILSAVAGYTSLVYIGGKVISFVKESSVAAKEDIRSLIRLQGVIDATGRSLQVSSRDFDRWASVLEDSLYIDKQSLMDATSVLMMYQSISTDDMPRILQLSADLATVLRTDIGGAATTIGMALESPVEGMSRLKRQGVFVTDETVRVITNLVEQNRLYDAQTVLLDEIESRVGGVAEKLKDAQVPEISRLETAWGKFSGEFGKIWNKAFGNASDWLGWYIEGITKPIQDLNDLAAAGDLIKAGKQNGFADLSLGDLEELIGYLERTDNLPLRKEAETLVPVLQEILSLRRQEVQAAEDAARREQDRLATGKLIAAELDKQKKQTDDLQVAYSSTEEGRIGALRTQLELLHEQQAADLAMIDAGRHDPEANQKLVDEAKARVGLYSAVIAAKQEELEGLVKIDLPDEETYISRLFGGKNARRFVLDIPVSFDFGRTANEKIEAELISVKSQIERVWSSGPSEDDTGEWQVNLDILVSKYNELKGQFDAISKLEGQRSRSQTLLDSLLTDEQKQRKQLVDLQTELTELEAAGLITADERGLLYDQEYAKLLKLTTAGETYLSKLFDGGNARQFVTNIPISFDFGRSAQETMEAQLQSLQSQIERVWSSGPSEDDAGEWQVNLDILVGKYEELKAQVDAVDKLEDQRTRAQTLRDSLLTDEQKQQKALVDLQNELDELGRAGLLTSEERIKLWEKEYGKIKKVKTLSETITDEFKAMGKALYDQFFSADAMGSQLSGTFSAIGSAIASGESGLDAFGSAMGDYFQQLTGQISSMAMAAGLRIIAEGGLAGLPVGLGLLVLGGVSGLASGLMGGSKGIDESILKSMEDEIAARQKLADSLNSSIDTEYELLKRQLDRNLIGVDEFRSGAGELQGQRNYADAQVALSEAIQKEISSLDNELKGMSGWDKFWSGRDEDIEDEVARLKRLFDSIDTASVEELRQLQATLKSMGLSLGSVPAFAEGGEFTTTGPRLILVGDNPGGREHVKVTPINQSVNGNQTAGKQQTVVYVQGDIYGIEDLFGKLRAVGVRAERRRA